MFLCMLEDHAMHVAMIFVSPSKHKGLPVDHTADQYFVFDTSACSHNSVSTVYECYITAISKDSANGSTQQEAVASTLC